MSAQENCWSKKAAPSRLTDLIPSLFLNEILTIAGTNIEIVIDISCLPDVIVQPLLIEPNWTPQPCQILNQS